MGRDLSVSNTTTDQGFLGQFCLDKWGTWMRASCNHGSRWVLGAALSLGLWGGTPLLALAQVPESQPVNASDSLDDLYTYLSQFPVDDGLSSDFYQGVEPDSMVTQDTLSLTEVSPPSLWRDRDIVNEWLGAFGFRIVRSWLAYQLRNAPDRVVDVSINSQYWNQLSYTEQYSVLIQFGNTARDYGYNLRLLRGTGFSTQLVGVYACDFDSVATSAAAKNEPLYRFLSPDQILTLPCTGSIDVFSIRGYRAEPLEYPNSGFPTNDAGL